MKWYHWTVAALLLLPAIPSGAAQSAPGFFTPVAAGDKDAGLNLQTTLVNAGFVDANGNDALDVADPDEAAYLDLDGSRTVTYADLRLTGFANYAAGTAVDYTNRDFGRTLSASKGWFARDASSAWFLDTDNSAALSAGDVRLTGAQAGMKVTAGDPDFGQRLTRAQEGATPGLRVAWTDQNGNMKRDATEPVYIDLNFDKQVSPGDPRVQATGLGLDNEPTRAEFEGTVKRLDDRDNELATSIGELSKDLTAQVGGVGQQLLILGILALVGFLALGWWVRKVDKRTATPKYGSGPSSPPTTGQRGTPP